MHKIRLPFSRYPLFTPPSCHARGTGGLFSRNLNFPVTNTILLNAHFLRVASALVSTSRCMNPARLTRWQYHRRQMNEPVGRSLWGIVLGEVSGYLRNERLAKTSNLSSDIAKLLRVVLCHKLILAWKLSPDY